MLKRYTWLPLGIAALGLVGCGSDTDSGPGTKTPAPNVIDLVVDANRDGLAKADDKADQDREEEWDATVGASFIANLDDDDLDGKRDCEDEIVNGDADALDLAKIVVSAWPDAKDDASGVLKVDQESAESVRIFKQGTDGVWTLVMGSVGPCTSPSDCTYAVEHRLSFEETKAGVTFGIEARRFKGMAIPTMPENDDAKKNAWTGLVDLTYEVQKGDNSLYTSDANPDGIDRVKMRVAPWVLFGSLGKHDELKSSKASTNFVKGNQVFADAAEVPYTPYSVSMSAKGGWDDIWTEDFFQTGWTGFPGENGAVQGMRIYNARPWGRPPTQSQMADYLPIKWILGNPAKNRPAAVLGPDRGGAAFYNPKNEGTGDTQDSHGAHDLVPPYEGQTMGRIITSTKVLKTTREFYATQSVQGEPIIINTTWLAVEHVDEFFHWVPAKTPRGWKLLYASPAMMLQMLQDLQAAGHGAEILHKGKGGGFQKTVDECLADTDLNEWSQVAEVKIQGHIDTLKMETGLTDDEIIGIPTWFEDLGIDEKVAWNPGMVNMRMIGDRADVPKPFGPVIDGKDPFEEDLFTRLGSSMHGLGADGMGLEIFFTDDWYYHAALGEVHCGTNESAPAPFASAFWWESGK